MNTMEIGVRRVDEVYREVIFQDLNTTIKSGYLSKKECFELAKEFQSAIDSLTENWGEP